MAEYGRFETTPAPLADADLTGAPGEYVPGVIFPPWQLAR